jgi:O-antigen biosynthesis protein
MNSSTAPAIRIGNFRTFPESRELNNQAGSTDAIILKLVGTNRRVLELGCGGGHMTRALLQRGCTVVGIEIHPEAAETAVGICERVIVGDLDYLDFVHELGNDRFDVILAAGILEHLKDPLTVLQGIRPFLLPNGHFVISVPNIAHVSSRLALLEGNLPQSKRGQPDQTQLQFFTRASLEKLMEEADLAVGAFERIVDDPGDPRHLEARDDPARVPPAVVEAISRDPEASTRQFIISGFPLPESGLAIVQERIKQLACEVAAARQDTTRLQLERDALQAEVLRLTDACGGSGDKLERMQARVDAEMERFSHGATGPIEAATRLSSRIKQAGDCQSSKSDPDQSRGALRSQSRRQLGFREEHW